ncbi:restriction endonuclease subunit S [Alistipes putredinis]|uniref:restriction endonuclease subunit S n=2 Tax=Alistipes putredinis TaxID=28117 RepID=UPI00242B101A|nr:restriction endonuclease subunit S [Alistipes putredinis]
MWKKVRLGEKCNMLCGYAFNGEDIVEQGSYLLMRGINITEGSIRHSSELDRYYSGSIEKLDKYKLAVGDLVIGMDGSKVGRNSAIVSSYEDGSYLVQRVCRIKSSIGNNYILQFINNTKFHQYVDTVKTSSAIPHISLGDIQNFRISIPPTQDETDKIAKLFLLLDERIATQNKIIEKLESLIRGIRNSLLYSDNGTPIRIGDILKERVEKTTVNNQHEILSSTVKGIFSQREYFSKDIASENNVGYKVIRLHDVVLSPQNLWMGNINYNDRFEVGIVSPSYKIFTIAEKYDKTFIASMLKTQRSLYNYMLVSEQGASIVRRNLNMEAFEQLVFKIPPYEKQCEIGRTMSTLRTRLAIANAIKIAYGQQKQWLLRQMFI